jgi:tRNA (cytidine32/uridine32-2'-O)-methyltransferase
MSAVFFAAGFPGSFRSGLHTIVSMLSAEARSRLAVVLVGARNPSNIGAAARAMQDFGFGDLRTVNEFAAPFEAAQLEAAQTVPKSAVGAADVMLRARRFDRLADAIADCHVVVGTTAIGGRELDRPVLTLQQSGPQILDVLLRNDNTRVALLFGSEKTGLTNEQLSYCSMLLTIPLYSPESDRHLSMNLGQSVAVCLYELTREGFENSRELPTTHHTQTTAEDRERLQQRLLDVMETTGYARRFPANAREHVVRKLAQNLATTRDEATTWLGVFRMILRSCVGSAKKE